MDKIMPLTAKKVIKALENMVFEQVNQTYQKGRRNQS